MINAPSTPTPTPTTPASPEPTGPFFTLDEVTQLQVLFQFVSLLNNPERTQTVAQLNQLTIQSVQFVTITSGKNAGEKRQVYYDLNGKAYYKLISDKNHVRRIYLEDYIDNDGEARHPNASMTMVKQYKKLVQDSIQPVALFAAAEEKKEDIVQADDTSSDVHEEVIVKEEEKDVTL